MAQGSSFHIVWRDGGREPKQAPNPHFPDGIDLDTAPGDDDAATCTVKLPYPARRCGVYIVECKLCGVRVGATTAGRPDDPRSIRIACKDLGHA